MANSTNVGNKKALLIAVRSVNKKSFPSSLHAHEHSESLKCLLNDKFNYPEANVVLMKDDAELPEHLWPSRNNILKQITKMVANATSNDQFFFYYHGYGGQVTCKHRTETDGKDEVIYAYTGKYIVDKKLREVLVDPLPRGSKLFLLSGDVVRTRRKSLTGRFLLGKPRTLPASSQQPLSSRFKCTGDCQKMRVEEQEAAHVVSLSACRSDEYVYDDNVAGATMTKVRLPYHFRSVFLTCSSQFFIECVCKYNSKYHIQT
ncbi:caspase domain-containing protein [Suillus variegatus]|nr:caspase domain-containing protein [Suillus variegatus]